MTIEQLEQQVFELTRRVYRLELQAGATPPVATAARRSAPEADSTPARASLAAVHDEHTEALRHLQSLKSAMNVAPPPTPLAVAPLGEGVESPIAALTPPVAPASAPPISAAAPIPTRKRAEGPSLEMRIGQNWMAWGGAIFIVLSAGFFVKLAYDNGWFGRIPPGARCAAAAAFGVALIGLGEWALRRVGRPAAVSLYSAGVGVLYLTAFATFKYFNLVSETGAFGLLSLVAAIGFAITIRGRTLAVGVLSIVGGYLTPVLLSGASSFPGALPLYFTMLLAVGLGLSAWMAQPFRPLRYLTLGAHALLATLWLVHDGRSEWQLALSFISAWWMIATAEMIYAALRGQSAQGNAITSLLATIWYAAVGCWVLHRDAPESTNVLGLFILCLALAAAGVAAWFGPGLSALRTAPRRAMERLAVSLWTQVGILLATAIGLHFDGPGIEGVGRTIGWLVMGLGCVELGRRLPSRGVTVFGLLVGSLGLVRLVLIDTGLSGLRATVVSVSAVTLTRWGCLALLAIGVTMVAAFRVRSGLSSRRVGLAAALAMIASLLWMYACIGQCDGLALTGAWVALALALLATQRWARPQRFLEIATFVLVFSGVRWMVFDAGATRSSPAWSPWGMALLFNEQMLLAAAIVGAAWWLARLHAAAPPSDYEGHVVPRGWREHAWLAAFLAGGFLLMIALSFEVDRALARATVTGAAWNPVQARMLWITLLWGAGGFCLWAGSRGVVAAFRGRGDVSAEESSAAHGPETIRNTGWAMLALCVLAWLTVDTLAWRFDSGVTLVPVVFNAQFAVGAALGVMMAGAAWLKRRDAARRGLGTTGDTLVHIAVGMVTLIGLWLGSLELDRFFAPEAGRVENAAMARQTSLSIYWGLYAIALLGIGFAKHAAWSRYAGLGLLAITIGKVMIVDMAEVRYVYRVLSFLALGVLLILTSVTYAKLRGKLLAEKTEAASG